jgi:ribose 1,5-bisphosphokinase PhnN
MADPWADQAQLSAGVQNRTALADIAVKCSEKTARFLTIAAEILARRVADRGNNSENSG